MTHYLVKHGNSEYRLHAEDGTEPTGTAFSERPDTTDLADDIADAGPGGSLLGDPTLRPAFVDVVSGGINYRDLTIPDETVPWQ